ncbi:MAG: hypothetical protein A3G76_14310 [Acidobacteria bacterium RIFCSPLOWO2_12_FULL_65_11]|nr:MAG: hypothetical protein A3H95_02220 [Acidobacteria bacterium RIFCSPLOWO2_02_FULL_64_15]OFW30188.1 MAG: hypothetical protein A3G76_14310 [Acidobacteria bacterium RIFCSPLOWO2_12_FULL_65_11]
MQILRTDVVRARHARWRVADIRLYESCQLFTLTGIDPANARAERRMLAPFDILERIERRRRPTHISMRLWRRVCRALVAQETPPGGLRCARRARIDLLPHQLEPALALLRGLGSRVLLADAVGLGKTIQAGLIVSELQALGAADRVLILTPPGLRDQWARELADRFEIDATILDARAVRRAVATLRVGVNPWRTSPVAIASIDYVRRADILTSVAACRWDLVIVDEAHGVAGNSDRHAAAAALTSRAPFVVLLTATPHSGDRRAFVSLCRLGALGTAPGDRLLLFRRTRADVRFGTPRRIHRLFVRPSAAEARMHALLARFSRAVQHEHGRARSVNLAHRGNPANRANPENSGIWLALSVLHKRALSSARSLQRSVERRLAALASRGADEEGQIQLPLIDTTGELTTADLPPAWPPALGLRDPSRERQMLGELAAAAAEATRDETKIGALGRLLRRIDEPAIVFTEYRDTLVHLRASLHSRVSQLHGGLTRDERLAAIGEFTRGLSSVLLATDAAGEGLNLHHACRAVINLELPWNPMRLEQRIGRVDRIGQMRTVHAFHLIARGSSEPRILARLEERMARAQADIGAPDPLGMDEEITEEGAMARAVIEQTAVEVRLKPDTTAEGPVEVRLKPDTTGVRLKPDTTTEATTNGGAADENLVTPALAADARAEVERIVRARALLHAGDQDALAQVDGRGPCLAAARRSQTRAALGRRLLLLCRAGMEAGAAGARCTAGSVLVPLLIELAGPGAVVSEAVVSEAVVSEAVVSGFSRTDTARPKADTTWDLLCSLDADIQRTVDLAATAWRQRASEIHSAFIGARLNRARAIGATDPSVPTIFQPGLFDRRSEHARLAILAAQGDRDLEWAATIEVLEQAAVLSPTDAVLLLVLTP